MGLPWLKPCTLVCSRCSAHHSTYFWGCRLGNLLIHREVRVCEKGNSRERGSTPDARAAQYLSLHSPGCTLLEDSMQGRKCWDMLSPNTHRAQGEVWCSTMCPQYPVLHRKPWHTVCSSHSLCCPVCRQPCRAAAKHMPLLLSLFPGCHFAHLPSVY